MIRTTMIGLAAAAAVSVTSAASAPAQDWGWVPQVITYQGERQWGEVYQPLPKGEPYKGVSLTCDTPWRHVDIRTAPGGRKARLCPSGANFASAERPPTERERGEAYRYRGEAYGYAPGPTKQHRYPRHHRRD
jgi:hypothetical protein